MSLCPNKSHPDWKKLLSVVNNNEDEAYEQYILNGFEIPEPDKIFIRSSKHQAIVNELNVNRFNLRKDDNAINSKTGKKGTYYITVNGTDIEVPNRITDNVEYAKRNNNFAERTIEEKASDEVRRLVGDKGHADINNILKRIIEGLSGNITTPREALLDDASYNTLETFFTDLINDYIKKYPGTKFYSEKSVYNPKTKEAGTIDFLAVLPDGKVDILDWKFVEFKNKDSQGRIIDKSVPWYKEKDYNIQITHYRRTLREGYGVSDFNKARIIPISVTYKKNVLVGMEIGSAKMTIDPGKEYLAPVPITGMDKMDIELTGNDQIDNMIHVLVQRRSNIENKALPEDSEEKAKQIVLKRERIDRINKAIRQLQLEGDIKSFLEDANMELTYISNTKDSMTLSELLDARALLNYYSDNLKKEQLSKEQAIKHVEEFEKITLNSQALYGTISKIIDSKIKDIAKEENIDNLFEEQPESGIMGRLFRTISQINHPIFKLFYKLVSKQNDKTEKAHIELNDKINKSLDKLKKWGESRGLSGTDIFKDLLQFDKDGKWTGNLVSVFKPEYFENRKEAWKNKDINFFKTNTKFNKERFDADLAKSIEVWKTIHKDKEDANIIIAKKVDEHKKKYDVTFNEKAYLTKNNFYLSINESWRSDKWNYIQENEALKDFYNLFTNTIHEFREYLPLDEHGNFIPNIKADAIDMLTQNGLNAIKGLGSSFIQQMEAGSDETVGMVDEVTGLSKQSIPMLYTKDINPDLKSKDLGVVLSLFGKMAYNYKHMSEIEAAAHTLQQQLSKQNVILTSKYGNPLKSEVTNQVATALKNSKDVELFNTYMDYYLYGVKVQAKDAIIKVGKKELSRNKMISKALSYFSTKSLAFNIVSGLANGVGGVSNLFFEGMKGRFYTNSDAKLAYGKLITRDKKSVALMEYFRIDSAETSFKLANNLSVNKAVKALTMDKFYVLQRSGDWLVENGTLLSLLQSHTLKDGKIVKKEKDDKSLYDLAEIKNDKISIEGLDEKEFNKFRRKVKYLYGTMKGNSNPDDVNQVKLTVLGQVMMQFRNWIPRMADERFGDLRYTEDLETYELGKYRSFLGNVWTKTFIPTILASISDSGLLGIGKGMVGSTTIEKRAIELYNKNLEKNTKLGISQEQYIEMHKQNVRSTIMELQLLTAFIALIACLKGGDDDDKDPKRRFFVKLLTRNASEISFWFNPDSMTSILKKPVPIVGLATDILNLGSDLLGEGVGYITNDDERIAKNKPSRSFNKLFPGLNAFENIWSIADPDYNKKDK